MKLKRIAVCVAAMVSSATLGSVPASSAGTGSTREYIIYNYATDTENAESYTLTASIDSAATYNMSGVIGTNDRVQYANSGIVHLCSPSTSATGFIVGDHTIVTAAHCVYHKDREDRTAEYFHNNIRIYLYDNEGNKVDSITAKETHIPKVYKSLSYGSSFNYDYALLTVSEDLSEYEHFDLGMLLSSAPASNLPISVSGFPSNLVDENGNEVSAENKLYIGSDYLTSVTSYRISYDNLDASGGQSGGPVFVTSSYQIGNKEAVELKTVVGIHTRSNRSGTRITPDLIKFFKGNDYNTYEE